jgi:hypothetical protein
MSKTKTILQWIAVPLAAVVAMTIAHILVIFLTARGLNMIFIGMDELKFAISKISGELAAGAAFVTAGTEVAPSKKKTVSIVLATIVVTLSVLSILYIIVKDLAIMEVAYTLAMSVSAIAYSYGYKED